MDARVRGHDMWEDDGFFYGLFFMYAGIHAMDARFPTHEMQESKH